MKKLVVLTGAGISAESGLKTFRDSDGLWENHDVNDVATPYGWEKNPGLVLDFYNNLRNQLHKAKPNPGHIGLSELQKYFDVHIITQNIDDLHERAGSKSVLHLHGELNKAISTVDSSLIYDVSEKGIHLGDKCEKGFQLRPFVVWFGEPVPAIEEAAVLAEEADIFVIVGTSLNVYPAAGLLDYVSPKVPVFLIDPNDMRVPLQRQIVFIREKASVGVKILEEKLLNGQYR